MYLNPHTRQFAPHLIPLTILILAITFTFPAAAVSSSKCLLPSNAHLRPASPSSSHHHLQPGHPHIWSTYSSPKISLWRPLSLSQKQQHSSCLYSSNVHRASLLYASFIHLIVLKITFTFSAAAAASPIACWHYKHICVLLHHDGQVDRPDFWSSKRIICKSLMIILTWHLAISHL